LNVCAYLVKVETKDLQQLEATSRGSDCHCRCLLTTEDAGPCPGKFGLRKIQYSVETISGGKDCHCSCTTPAPPNVCEVRSLQIQKCCHYGAKIQQICNKLW